MRWIKKNWILIAAAIAAYMFRDKIKGMMGGTPPEAPTSKTVSTETDFDI
jgi:hypothetical protein